jgi:hypothetical protein
MVMVSIRMTITISPMFSSHRLGAGACPRLAPREPGLTTGLL